MELSSSRANLAVDLCIHPVAVTQEAARAQANEAKSKASLGQSTSPRSRHAAAATKATISPRSCSLAAAMAALPAAQGKPEAGRQRQLQRPRHGASLQMGLLSPPFQMQHSLRQAEDFQDGFRASTHQGLLTATWGLSPLDAYGK